MTTGAGAEGAAVPGSVKARLSVMMFLQYFVQGSYLPVISSYLQDQSDVDAVHISTADPNPPHSDQSKAVSIGATS